MINGDNARLQQIEAELDLSADAHGPGSPAGPGPTAPFDWGATQQVSIVMPVNGSTTSTGGTGVSITGTGGERATGAMLVSSSMAQLFMAQVGREAETFWRKGECIDVTTTEESRTVDPGETIELGAEAVGKFDGQKVEAPIVASFTGKESLEPADSPVDPPTNFDFIAGSEVGDKGTIALEQVGKRGIGRKTVEFIVGADDYRFEIVAPGFGGSAGRRSPRPSTRLHSRSRSNRATSANRVRALLTRR